MGDEYFANLDHIESVENFKEGYESEAHCSDSEGSGVDVSRIKIQPSALVSANPVGRPPKKGESKFDLPPPLNFFPVFLFISVFFIRQKDKVQAHQGTARTTKTKIQRAKRKVTVRTTRL